MDQNISPSSGNNKTFCLSVVECWEVQFLVDAGFSLSSIFMITGIFSTGNGTGNPVHLPNPYPTCVLTNLNSWCRVFQLIQTLFVCFVGEWKKKDVYYTANQEILEDQRIQIKQSTGHFQLLHRLR